MIAGIILVKCLTFTLTMIHNIIDSSIPSVDSIRLKIELILLNLQFLNTLKEP